MKNEEEIYNSALQTAGRAIKKFNIVGILPGDLVNDSWIDVYNSGMEIDFNTLNKFITNKAYQINYNKDSVGSIKYTNCLNDPSLQFCKCCQEDLPIDMFGITIRKKTNTRLIQTFCKICQAEKMRAYRKKKNPIPKRGPNRLLIETVTEANRRRFAEYFSKNKEKWNAYIRARYEKQKAAKNAA